MATYRGTDGNLSIGGNAIGELKSWELNIDRDIIDTTSMQDTAVTKDLDIPNGTGSCEVDLDYDDTAQAALIDQVVASASATAAAAVFTMASGKTFTCNVLCASAGVNSAVRNGNVRVRFGLEVSGAVSVVWA